MSQAKNRRAELACIWWQELTGIGAAAQNVGAGRGNAAAAARLRRARTPIEALMEPEAVHLVRRIAHDHPDDQVRVASLASTLAHVREDDAFKVPVAQRLGGSDEDARLMKPARFRRLMLAEPGAERMTAFRRAIEMLKRSANVYDLAHAWLLWDSPSAGDRIRTDWMFAYVGAREQSVPGVSETSLPETNQDKRQETAP